VSVISVRLGKKIFSQWTSAKIPQNEVPLKFFQWELSCCIQRRGQMEGKTWRS